MLLQMLGAKLSPEQDGRARSKQAALEGHSQSVR